MENTLLNLIPAAYLPEVHISQYDIGRTLTFNLKEGASDYNVPTGATVTVKATKPSGFGFAVPCTFSGGVVTLVVTETMTPEHGRFPAELSIVSGNTTIGTSNFIFNIERSPHPKGTIDGDAETIIPELTLLVERIEAAAEDVDEKAELFLNLSAEAETLPAGSLATANYSDGVLTLGIPRGYDGDDTKADAIVKSASGEVASFSDGGNGLLVKSLNVNIVPKQSGSGDPSPSNVRPISGYSDVNVNVCGVNVWDEEWENGDINITNGETRADSSRIRSKNFINVKPNTSYYAFWGGVQYNGLYVCFYDENKNWVSADRYSGWDYIENGTFTTPSWCYYMKFYNNGTSYGNNISINYPSTDTTYHIGANNESYPISLGQTVYGGTLDVVSGKLTLTWASRLVNSMSWSYVAPSSSWAKGLFYTSDVNSVKKAGIENIKCERYKTLRNNTDDYLIFGNAPNGYVYIVDSTYSSASAMVSAIGTMPIIYELATPIEIQLTPTEVKTLLGINNIFADSGSVEVEYRADTTLAYNELLSLIASLS